MVFSGLVIAWRFATCPTSFSQSFVNATTEGVVKPPSSFWITLTSEPSITATQEFVVPKSMPIILLIQLPPFAMPKYGHAVAIVNLPLDDEISNKRDQCHLEVLKCQFMSMCANNAESILS